MNRIDRVSAILIHLQTKKFVTAEEIALRFDISKRTVYRDLMALGEAGIPIGAEPGKGYHLVEGYHLPPVMFTPDEASAMLTAEKMVEKLTDISVSTHFQSAMMKIKSVLPDKQKDYINQLQSNIEVFYNFKSEFPNNYMSDIQFALAHRQTITIDYKSIQTGNLTLSRVIEPIGVCFYSLGWHLIGFCRMRNEYRDFRVDRIVKLLVNAETYQERKCISVRDHFYQLAQSAKLTEVVVRFEPTIAVQLQSMKYYYGFIDEAVVNNCVEMTFLTNDLNYMARWLVLYADTIEIISPGELKDILKDLIRRICGGI
jgi:predicted DNA-binding transcriptional regulator YafY